jgi:hypothetical protein
LKPSSAVTDAGLMPAFWFTHLLKVLGAMSILAARTF